MKYCLLLGLLLPFFALSEQEPLDSVKPHSIRKAVILSSVLPGSGQVYNHLHMPKGQKKAFWKVPMIYAGLGATGYYFASNLSLQRELKAEYSNRQDGNPGSLEWSMYDDQGVLTLYNMHRNRQDLFLLGFILVYALQVADAGVEAHFVTFDVSEDLTLNVDPYWNYRSSFGMSLRLNFR